MNLAPGILDQTLAAYRSGAFPMAEDGTIGFYTCDPRSVYFFDSFHIPQRLQRISKKKPFIFSINKSFELVVQNCRIGREEWISDQLVDVYVELHRHHIAHSFEAWQDGLLAGGIYGTQFGAAFLAESMFHTVTHASNLCLLFMMETLQKKGFHFCDIQYANAHTAKFNPTKISHADFMTRFALAQEQRLPALSGSEP